MIFFIIAPASERTPVTNREKPDQPARQLSANNAIFTSIQKICIKQPDLHLHKLP